MADKIPDISPNVDETMKELETHGSFELPVETYTDNCEIFRSLYNHWHKEMEIICIDKGNGLARLNRETLRLKEGDLLIVNSGVLHGIKSDSRHILYYRSVVHFSLDFPVYQAILHILHNLLQHIYNAHLHMFASMAK